ncbi:hypothetical protein CEXT_356641 [Caerostris extrusa]|uniref:Uncharacterized protein n=1 Tax=Caerostris extrusa TaxID=172846 RepID=A0AAV4T5W7_CAEEX|nr:hypothetical protein CEXT_356641 [Caerostris extrusa]
MSFVWIFYSLEEAASRNGDDDRRNVRHIILMLQSRNSKAKMYHVLIFYSLEEAASRNEDDERRNVHHVILMLQSGTARRRCHLLGYFIPLKKQRQEWRR